ncbi:MAG: hypothetical protein HYZ44_13055 [Bacteroidetes bacterium]|nr:hypothetical protein [Bacteroidota bacterium]
MKIISLFTKAPQHQRFSYRPRYYDPKKEEMQEREERIRRELELERGAHAEAGDYRKRIAGSFQAARKRSKPSAEKSAVIMRFGVLLFMTLLLMAMFTWGKDALYAGFLIVPFYLYMKFKNFKRS